MMRLYLGLLSLGIALMAGCARFESKPISAARTAETLEDRRLDAPEIERFNIATTAWQVRSNVRSRLLEVVVANERAVRLRKQLRIQEELVTRLGQRVEAGAASSSEVLPLRIAAQRVRLDLADAERQRA